MIIQSTISGNYIFKGKIWHTMYIMENNKAQFGTFSLYGFTQ